MVRPDCMAWSWVACCLAAAAFAPDTSPAAGMASGRYAGSPARACASSAKLRREWSQRC
jgi:hypothetical protein